MQLSIFSSSRVSQRSKVTAPGDVTGGARQTGTVLSNGGGAVCTAVNVMGMSGATRHDGGKIARYQDFILQMRSNKSWIKSSTN